MYSTPEANQIAHSFRSIDARTSRLEGLRNAAAIAHLYSQDEDLTPVQRRAYAEVIKSAVAMLIARDVKRPRKVGIKRRMK